MKTTLFGLLAIAVLTLHLSADAAKPPPPKYLIVEDTLQIYDPVPGEDHPEDAAAYIESEYLKWDWYVDRQVLHCPASVERFVNSDFFEGNSAVQYSERTRAGLIRRQTGQCLRSDESEHCLQAACAPDSSLFQYRMLAICKSPHLAFKTQPNRCECSVWNHTWVDVAQKCIPVIEVDLSKAPPKHCSVGNPVYPMTGKKTQKIDLGIRIGGESLVLTYDSSAALPAVPAPYTSWTPSIPAFGAMWSGSLHRYILRAPYGGNSGNDAGVEAVRGNGQTYAFTRGPSGEFNSAYVGVNDRLISSAQYLDISNSIFEDYANWAAFSGELVRSRSAMAATGGGVHFYWSQTFDGPEVVNIDALFLRRVEDDFGRTVRFDYEFDAGANAWRVNKVTGPDGAPISLEYANGTLASVTWADGKTVGNLYELADSRLLTGTVDELAKRVGTYSYDGKLATGTAGASGVNAYTVSHSVMPYYAVAEYFDGIAVYRTHTLVPSPQTTVTDPSGSSSQLAPFASSGETVGHRSQAAGAGCGVSAQTTTYDDHDNAVAVDDFDGNRTCSAYDLTRNLETTRVEGLPDTAGCSSVIPANAAIPAGSRKVSTQWHATWRLPAKIAEPGRLTTNIYNGAGASCVQNSPTLPDGSPVSVVCQRIDQATTDLDGHLGFAAPLQANIPARIQTWTYNQHGQVLTAKGPRTDVNDTTRYAYYSDTAFTGTDPYAVGHTMGDLLTLTDATGNVTRYTQYNKTGQLLEMLDPNGVITSYSYDLRQRLTSTTVAGQTTVYDYWPTGLLKKVTQPDASFVTYEYDDAHRLTALQDSQSNRIEYTLDNAGNRTAEKVRDPSGNLRRQLTRSIDALNRVQKTTGRE